jgi:hypothetical protein
LFQASVKKAEQEVVLASSRVTEVRKKTAIEMQQRVDEAVQESIAKICGDCQNDSGTGWLSRSVTRIEEGVREAAEMAKERTWSIADGAVEEIESAVKQFCEVAVQEMSELGSNLPVVLREAVERSRLSTPQEQIAQLRRARETHPKAAA